MEFRERAMSEPHSDGAWFRVRTRRWGYNHIPVTWQGWVMTLAITPVLLATVFAGDPSRSKTASLPLFLKMKALSGLSGMHLPQVTVAALIIVEVAVFVALVFWKSRTLKPLD
jgi:hypothetical protein